MTDNNVENSTETAQKQVVGRPFEKGASGNPGGRPKLTQEELDVRAACKLKARDALATIERIMQYGENERNQLTAALALIERGYGKPEQPVDATVNGNITVNIKHF